MAGQQAGKRKTKRTFRKLNPKRYRLLKETAKGTPNAWRVAGYSHPQSANLALKQMRPELLAEMEKLGWGMQRFAEHQRDLLEANKTLYFSHQGIVCDKRTVKDNGIRLAAGDQYLKLFGLYAPVNVEVSGTVTHELTEREKQEAVECVARILEYEAKEASERETPLLGEGIKEEK